MKKSSLTTRGNYRRISRNKRITRIAIFGLVLVLAMIILPRLFTFAANLILSPIHATESWLLYSKNSLPYFFRDRKALVDEIMDLKAIPPEGVSDHLAVGRLSRENDELRKLLNDKGQERIVAGVSVRPNVTPYDVLVIDRGEADGVVLGAPVYIGNDTIIGIVVSLSANSALVEMVTSPNFQTTVYIYGPDIYTTAVGIGGGVLRVGVPQGIKLEAGNLVVLPAADPGIFGEVSLIDSIPTRPEQYGFVMPEISINSLRLVAVGTKPLESVTFNQARENVIDTYNDLFVVPVPEDVLVDVMGTTTDEFATTTATTTEIIEVTEEDA